MKWYDVFDCTVSEGRAVSVPTKFLADLLAKYMSRKTGNFHDFA